MPVNFSDQAMREPDNAACMMKLIAFGNSRSSDWSKDNSNFHLLEANHAKAEIITQLMMV